MCCSNLHFISYSCGTRIERPPEYARKSIKAIDQWRKQFKKETGSTLVFGADELYLRARLSVPPHAYYEDFAQIENGVGMARQLLDDLRAKGRSRP